MFSEPPIFLPFEAAEEWVEYLPNARIPQAGGRRTCSVIGVPRAMVSGRGTFQVRGAEDDQYGHIVYNESMRTVNISDLKAHLCAHIRLVKDGEEVLVCDRSTPVARIVPCRLTDHSEQEHRLIARGVLTPPRKKRAASVSWPMPPGNVSEEVMEQVRQEEREGR